MVLGSSFKVNIQNRGCKNFKYCVGVLDIPDMFVG